MKNFFIDPTFTSVFKRSAWMVFIAICLVARTSFASTFPANPASLGAIPDSDIGSPVCQNNSTTFRDVTFTVTGVSGPAFVTAVSFNASHTFLQDLEVSLRAPGGSPSHLLFSSTGTTSTVANTCAGSANDLSSANTYTFSDGASANWWTTAATNPVPTSSNRTVVAGPTSNPPATTNMGVTFFSAGANGTWTLRFRDRGAGDTGTVTAAGLTLMVEPPINGYLDMNGDGKTDWSVIRNAGGPSGQLTWYTQYNGLAGGQTDPWGLQTDTIAPGDYDGDGKTDISVWRPGPAGAAVWYTLLSSNGTARIEAFGQSGDFANVQGDYDGDGKDDIAVYRPSNSPTTDPSIWYYRTAQNGPVFAVPWGQMGDFSASGDYDNDGKNDFVIQRNAGGGQARFWILFATGSITSFVFGAPADLIAPGDYDGDGKTDIAVVKGLNGQMIWWIHPSTGGPDTATFWGLSTDFPTPGDYDGDGRTDIALWRPSATPGGSTFFVNKSTGGVQTFAWGAQGDYPTASSGTH